MPRELARLRQRLKTLKKNCIEAFVDYNRGVYGASAAAKAYYRSGTTGIGTDLVLGDSPALREFCKMLDDSIEHIRPFGGIRKGAPLSKINLLFAFWGFIWSGYLEKKTATKRVDWDLLIDLYAWFWRRLGDYELYDSIRMSNEDMDREYLKNQFSKHRERNTRLFKHFPYTPARRGFLVWLGKRRPFVYHWSEIELLDVSRLDSNPHFDDKRRAIELIRTELAGKKKFREAVMLPDMSHSID